MQLDLKTIEVKQRRQTFGHIARRFGTDRPASRYEEGTYDVQAVEHFHYRPTWDPRFQIFDPNKTRVKMTDWYALTDVRQYYYATYNIARARMYEAVERNFDLIERANLLDTVDPKWLAKIRDVLVPLRHYEWGANIVNAGITYDGYGTAITQAACFAMADRLGLAQLISRIGLTLDNGDGTSLDGTAARWTGEAKFQGLRRVVEDMLVVDDWFEALLAQNFAVDGIVHGLVYGAAIPAGNALGGTPVSLMCEFIAEWRTDSAKWIDGVLKAAAKDSPENAALLAGWYRTWRDRALEAVKPLAEGLMDGAAASALAEVAAQLDARAARLGIA